MTLRWPPICLPLRHMVIKKNCFVSDSRVTHLSWCQSWLQSLDQPFIVRTWVLQKDWWTVGDGYNFFRVECLHYQWSCTQDFFPSLFEFRDLTLQSGTLYCVTRESMSFRDVSFVVFWHIFLLKVWTRETTVSVCYRVQQKTTKTKSTRNDRPE